MAANYALHPAILLLSTSAYCAQVRYTVQTAQIVEVGSVQLRGFDDDAVAAAGESRRLNNRICCLVD